MNAIPCVAYVAYSFLTPSLSSPFSYPSLSSPSFPFFPFLSLSSPFFPFLPLSSPFFPFLPLSSPFFPFLPLSYPFLPFLTLSSPLSPFPPITIGRSKGEGGRMEEKEEKMWGGDAHLHTGPLNARKKGKEREGKGE
jgi:hypothetical protein